MAYETCQLPWTTAHLLQLASVAKRPDTDGQQIHGTQRLDGNAQSLQPLYPGHARQSDQCVEQPDMKTKTDKTTIRYEWSFLLYGE